MVEILPHLQTCSTHHAAVSRGGRGLCKIISNKKILIDLVCKMIGNLRHKPVREQLVLLFNSLCHVIVCQGFSNLKISMSCYHVDLLAMDELVVIWNRPMK